MIRVLFAVMLMASATTAHAADPPAAPWTLTRVVDGIVVWSAETPPDFWGYARGKVNAPPDAIFHRIGNFENLPNMFPWLDRVRVLERGEQSALVYFHYGLPWPLSDRSYTAEHHWWTEPDGTIVLDVEGANGLGPPADGAIQVQRVLTRIVMAPAADGIGSDVEYLFRANLAGMLPHAVRSQTAWKVPLNVLLSMRRSLEPRYAAR